MADAGVRSIKCPTCGRVVPKENIVDKQAECEACGNIFTIEDAKRASNPKHAAGSGGSFVHQNDDDLNSGTAEEIRVYQPTAQPTEIERIFKEWLKKHGCTESAEIISKRFVYVPGYEYSLNSNVVCRFTGYSSQSRASKCFTKTEQYSEAFMDILPDIMKCALTPSGTADMAYDEIKGETILPGFGEYENSVKQIVNDDYFAQIVIDENSFNKISIWEAMRISGGSVRDYTWGITTNSYGSDRDQHGAVHLMLISKSPDSTLTDRARQFWMRTVYLMPIYVIKFRVSGNDYFFFADGTDASNYLGCSPGHSDKGRGTKADVIRDKLTQNAKRIFYLAAALLVFSTVALGIKGIIFAAWIGSISAGISLRAFLARIPLSNEIYGGSAALWGISFLTIFAFSTFFEALAMSFIMPMLGMYISRSACKIDLKDVILKIDELKNMSKKKR